MSVLLFSCFVLCCTLTRAGIVDSASVKSDSTDISRFSISYGAGFAFNLAGNEKSSIYSTFDKPPLPSRFIGYSAFVESRYRLLQSLHMKYYRNIPTGFIHASLGAAYKMSDDLEVS